MSVMQVGLVDTTGQIDTNLVQAVAMALNVQVTRDVPQYWPIQASVQYLPDPGRVPSGVWPVRLVPSLPQGEGGFHLDQHNQPYAEVVATPADDSWSIAASHETIEMLVDPSGNRMQASNAVEIVGKTVEDGVGQFNYLVEACDPCEAPEYGYEIQGVLVSDFITPHFYDPGATPGTRYSFSGALTKPRDLLPGGYISFIDEATNKWQQILYLGPTPKLRTLPPGTGGEKSMRQWVNNSLEREYHDQLRGLVHSTGDAERMALRRKILDEVARSRADRYRSRVS